MSEHQRWRNLHRPVAHALHARRPRARRAARGGRRAAGVAVMARDRAAEYLPPGPVATAVATLSRELEAALARIREPEAEVAALKKEQPK